MLSNAVVKYCCNPPEDVKALIINIEEVDMDEPDMPDNSLLSDVKADLHKSNYKDDMQVWKQRVRYYTSSKSAMCSVVLSQCDAAMQAKLQVTEDWEANKTDLLFVLKAAQAACISVWEHYSMHVEGREAFCSLANCFQSSDTALIFKQRFLACKKKIVKVGIGIKFAKNFLELDKKKNPKLDDAAATEAATHHFLRAMMLMNSNAPQFVTYPESVKRAFTMVSVIEETSDNTGRSATSLAQANESSNGQYQSSGGRGGKGGPRQGAGRGGGQRLQPGRKNNCHRRGSGQHFYTECTNDADSCGEEEDNEVVDTEVSCNFNRGYDCVVTLAQQGKISLSPNLILLDSCSMCSVCNDSSLLHNVQHFKDHGLSQGLRIVSNGGTMDCKQVGSISTLSFPVWYNANSIANILLMSEVVQDWRLTMDTLVENAIWVYHDDGQILKFVECAGGLYAHDRSNPSHKITTHIVNTETVESCKSEYTRCQETQAYRARNLIRHLAYPSQSEIENLISNNFFCHNDLLVDDFHRATTIVDLYRQFVL